MAAWTELVKAISGFAWPIAFVVVAFMLRHYIGRMLGRESVTIKVAGMEISAADAAKQAGAGVADLVKRVADLENGLGPDAPVPKEAPPRSSREGISLLWVDDYPSNNAFLIQKFEEDGMRVRMETSTSSGLAAIKRYEFDGIISDLGRVENGVEDRLAGLNFVRALRQDGVSTPILIFAGPRSLQHRDELLAAGASEVTSSLTDVYRFVAQLNPGRG